MDALLEFVWKSTGVLLLFTIVYQLFLKRLTFFNANRWFLLMGLVASMVFPFIEITQKVYVATPQEMVTPQQAGTPMAYMLESDSLNKQPVVQEPALDLELLALYAYFAIVLFFLGKMVVELASLFRLIKSGVRVKREGFVFVTLSRKLTPFSFFKYICYSAQEHDNVELQLIIDHEKVHARQWHSVDLLVSHVYRAFFWWNPLAWLVKKQIGENLEYIADAVAKRQHAQGITYERALLSRAASHMQPALANNFFTPFIKQRILMLQKEASATWNAYKYALILPVMLVFIYSFNRVQEIEYVEKVNTTLSAASERRVKGNQEIRVGNITGEEIHLGEDSVINRKKNVYFEIITNSLDVDLQEYADNVNAARPYKIKFESVKRDNNGRLKSVVVACKFLNKDWDRSINLIVEKDEINYFFMFEEDFQIQRGATETGYFANSNKITYNDYKKGESVIFETGTSKKPIVERFDTKEQVYSKIKTLLGKTDQTSSFPLLVLNDKIVDKETFKNAFETLDGEAIGSYYNAKEATEKFGEQGKNGAWSIVIKEFSNVKTGKFGGMSLTYKLTFDINANTSDKELDSRESAVKNLYDYEIKFEDRKRDASGKLTELTVMTKFPNKSWKNHVVIKFNDGQYTFSFLDDVIHLVLGESGKEIFISATESKEVGVVEATKPKFSFNVADVSFETDKEQTVKEVKITGSTVRIARRHDSVYDNAFQGNKKTTANVVTGKPLTVLNGQIVSADVRELSFDAQQVTSASVLKGKQATDKYGDAGKNGVVEIVTASDPKVKLELERNTQKLATATIVEKRFGDFKIIFKEDGNRITMQSLQGTAWKELSFTLGRNKEQAINAYGMVNLSAAEESVAPKFADFLFTVTRTRSGYELKGLKGTAWTNLRFTVPKKGKQAVNQFGTTTMD